MTLRQLLETGLSIGFGAVAGALLRYALSVWIAQRTGVAFPWGTLLINFTGSVGLALFLGWVSGHPNVDSRLVLLVATGFFGAYTTFSTFANESIALLRAGDWLPALGYIVGTNLTCLLGAAVGLVAGLRL